jgi:hypothetical protein
MIGDCGLRIEGWENALARVQRQAFAAMQNKANSHRTGSMEQPADNRGPIAQNKANLHGLPAEKTAKGCMKGFCRVSI